GRWVIEEATLGPVPQRAGGPPILIGGMVRASLERVGRLFDGWFPNAPDPERWRAQWDEIRDIAGAAGRDLGQLTGAVYLTMTIDEDRAQAEARMNAFMQNYYGRTDMRARQANYAGPAEGAAAWLDAWVRAGVQHMVLRFAGDPAHHLEAIARLRPQLSG
ncbi:MAG: LLM class flavin-dependent oxidoreductase, partial [Thiohalocapsa sp.]